MNGVLLVLIVLLVAAIGLAVYASSKASGKRTAASLADAKADARRLIERLGGQVLNLTGTDDASKQAMADASERYTAASSQIDQATTGTQALLAKQSAIEGLYYARAARVAMGMDPGPELELLSGQKSAGTVTEDRSVQFEGRDIAASPGRRRALRTTTPAAASPAGPFPRAGTQSPGGSRLWLQGPGALARSCCSARCSPGWAASAMTRRVSRTVTATASRTAWTRASSMAAAGTAAAQMVAAAGTAAAATAGAVGTSAAAATSEAGTSGLLAFPVSPVRRRPCGLSSKIRRRVDDKPHSRGLVAK